MSKVLLSLIIFLLLVSSRTSIGSSSSLKLILDKKKDNFLLSESIDVSITLYNADKYYWSFFPSFFPANSLSGYSGRIPKTELNFLIKTESGSYIRHIGKWNEDRLATPSPCDFLTLPPSFFYGRDISLNKGKFAYAFQERGKYKIKAQLQIDSHEWLTQRINARKLRRDQINFDLDRVFNGTLESEEIEIEVK